MAPKKSELPISLREKIVSLHENGLSYREIGKKVNVCFSTVRYIIKRHKERGYTSNNLRSGRPKKLSLRIKRNIIREASKNPFVSAFTLANDVASTSGVQICAQSVRNVLRANMLSNFRNTSYQRLGDHSNGVFTTRLLLEVFLFNFAVGIMLEVGSLYTEEVKLWIALIFSAISFFIICMGSLEDISILLVTETSRGIWYTFQSSNVTRPEYLAEVEGEELDEPVANINVEDVVLGAPVGDDDVAGI
ncbi:putative transposase rhodnius neglectus [Trichonephila inaurata madagascariensis]|uniref:Putative transposase rhodnius neglectus n=1 Tax=Trichonephila inaurata madagascariensis TaxID=2747483 RepID=A0A8X7CJ73_9ARAC|nr:putative transposase rhodnius neglectus [Trichonephila inaurata madagascariensis]